MPYKKRITGNFWLNGKNDLNCYNGCASVTNVGRIPIFIKRIEITDKRKNTIGSLIVNCDIYHNCIMLSPGEFTVAQSLLKNDVFENNSLNLNGHIKLKVTEIDGTVHYISKGFSVG